MQQNTDGEKRKAEQQAPSIFNDVIGPVMRGPSSSHVAGAARIGSLVRQALGETPRKVTVEFDRMGALAKSHEGHGTDMGFACGILGISLTDERVDQYRSLLRENGVDIRYCITDCGAEHPNFYRISAWDSRNQNVKIDAVSTGGGMVEMTGLNGMPLSVKGDYFESCWIAEGSFKGGLQDGLPGICPRAEEIFVSANDGKTLINIKTVTPLDWEEKKKVEEIAGISQAFFFEPLLPTGSYANCHVPFRTAGELMEFNREKQWELWELALFYESIRGNISRDEVFRRMEELVCLMDRAVETGLKGTEYGDRILHAQSGRIEKAEKEGRLVPGDVMNGVIRCITAVMETKSSMGVIVAAPTAGSCGCLPGTLLGFERAAGKKREETVKGFLAAGLIGVFFAEEATFAAEAGGCQMECGAASGMAAAGVAQMMGGDADTCINAASVALQGLTGLVCDPVANRVEVPCLNKNIVGGMNALSGANMALAGFDPVIPLDEVIQAMYDIGLKLPLELRCTLGGLGKTKTSLEIRKRLEEGEKNGDEGL